MSFLKSKFLVKKLHLTFFNSIYIYSNNVIHYLWSYLYCFGLILNKSQFQPSFLLHLLTSKMEAGNAASPTTSATSTNANFYILTRCRGIWRDLRMLVEIFVPIHGLLQLPLGSRRLKRVGMSIWALNAMMRPQSSRGAKTGRSSIREKVGDITSQTFPTLKRWTWRPFVKTPSP